MTLPRLLVLTDRAQLPASRTLPETVAACVQGGATHVVMRELDLSTEARAELAAELTGIPGVVLITARTWLPGASGVHLCATQAGDDRAPFHGSSCHSEGEVRRAVGAGATYLTVSPVAPSDSKPGYGPLLRTSELRHLAGVADGTPVFALGGVGLGNAHSFRAAGAHGVAVMGALMRSDDPVTLTRHLLAAVGR